MEGKWFRDCLFSGMSANAFKLGTVLSLGWFWFRLSGCSVMYRGKGMEEIDFHKLLAVGPSEAQQLQPPDYFEHENDSKYFYIIRRVNLCGMEEQSLGAAVRVVIDPSGELAEPEPNAVFGAKIEHSGSNKVKLLWFYCPVGQGERPVCFNIYTDNGTGQLDYETAIAKIPYTKPQFYSYEADVSGAGKHLFAIRAEGGNGVENSSLVFLQTQLLTVSPEAIDILKTEAV